MSVKTLGRTCVHVHNVARIEATIQDDNQRAVLLDAIETHQAAYETTLEEDERTLAAIAFNDGGIGSVDEERFELMLRFRLTEKRMLQRLRAALTDDSLHDEL